MPYSQVTVSSYNSSPPTDDGSTETINRVTWAGIKTKLGDPVKTAIEAVDDAVQTTCDTMDSTITSLTSTLSTISSDLTTAQSSLYAPAATAKFFVQTAAPTGWTKDTTHNDKALRLVSGTPSTGGSTAFTSVFTSRTISSTQMPAHTHTVASGTITCSLTNSTLLNSVSKSGDLNNRETGTGFDPCKSLSSSSGSFTATVSFSGTSSSIGSGTGMDFAVQYVDIILATKN